MFVFAGSRPSRVPPTRSVFGCQQLLLLVLILAAWRQCGSAERWRQRPRRPATASPPMAWQEWTRFGRSTVVYGGQVNGYINRTGVSERSEPLASRIGDYWGSCGHPEWNGRTSEQAVVGRVRLLGDGQVRRTAAAISRATAATAATSRRSTIASSAAARRFALHAPNEYSPKPGDLVCTGTAGPTWRHADSRTAQRRIDSTASHCDIVTDVRGGYVQPIGGNVKNSVTMSLYPGRFARPPAAGARPAVAAGGRRSAAY